MAGVATLLAEARSAGLKLRTDGEKLIIRGPRVAEPIANALLAHRPTIPADWIAGVAQLTSMAPPGGISTDRWATLVADAAGFFDRWAAQAARLGWGTLDVFGVNVVRPFERLDGAGLVRLLNGREVVALTETEAVIQCSTGERQAYRRKPAGAVMAKRCLLWELAGAIRIRTCMVSN